MLNYHTMKIYMGMKVKHHASTTSATDSTQYPLNRRLGEHQS